LPKNTRLGHIYRLFRQAFDVNFALFSRQIIVRALFGHANLL